MTNIYNFARGVGRTAENAFAYFGPTITDSSRRLLFTKLIGNDKEGKQTNTTWRHKIMRLFRGCQALTLCYDNYQCGVTLQHQRGKHSSAFFKGTHQCGHKMEPYDDITFDAFHVEFTQLNQDIPSPNGMPAFEVVDLECPASFFLDYDEFESVTLPDFTGDRVRAYAGLREIATQIKYFARAFPKPDEDRDYFSQCHASFNKSNLIRLRHRIHSEKGKRLCLSAKNFQANTVWKWNPTVDESTLSIFLGLVGIDEASSKECGAITLDLLLRLVKR